jgi:Protein of unknown function (DUF1348)
MHGTRVCLKEARWFIAEQRLGNRWEFIVGRAEIAHFLARKWNRELDSRRVGESKMPGSDHSPLGGSNGTSSRFIGRARSLIPSLKPDLQPAAVNTVACGNIMLSRTGFIQRSIGRNLSLRPCTRQRAHNDPNEDAPCRDRLGVSVISVCHVFEIRSAPFHHQHRSHCRSQSWSRRRPETEPSSQSLPSVQTPYEESLTGSTSSIPQGRSRERW